MRTADPIGFLKPLVLPGNFSLQLCAAINAWRYEDLPASVVSTLKRMLLDTLGNIAGAAQATGIPELNRRLMRWEHDGSTTGLIGMQRYSPPSAALANGSAAHALDFDDFHDMARVHTSCVVFPALLATAEDIGAVSGDQFLLALAIGAELHARLGLACYNSLGRGWHPTMVLGTMSGAIAAGRLLALDDESSCNALGLAFHQASGSAQSAREGVLSKRLGAGFAARNAVVSAFLAADGISGARQPLEGNAGLFALYERNEVRPEFLADGLGDHWRIEDFSFKPYPGCRCSHTSIGLGISLHHEGVQASAIESIDIGLGEVNWLTIGEPYDVDRASVAHAQFNVSYGFARALTDGRFDLDSYAHNAIVDPAVAKLARKIRVKADPAIGQTEIAPARIRLTFVDGRTLEVFGKTIKGSPEDPMSNAEMLEKFRTSLARGVGASKAQADRLAEVIDDLEHQSDVAEALISAFPSVRTAEQALDSRLSGNVRRKAHQASSR